MDTDRDRDVTEFEVHEENRKLVEEFYRLKLGKRAQRLGNAWTEGNGLGVAGGETATGTAGPTAP